jgi:CTP synthase (UTP-ammonia lyase)
VNAGVLAVVGDYGPERLTHKSTQDALHGALRGRGFEWLATEDAAEADDDELASYAGFLVAPSPYRSMGGALRAIRVAREREIPLLGTCGGFQHIVLETVRDVLGETAAEHAETSPDAPRLAVTPLACSLEGTEGEVRLEPGSRVAALYGAERAVEPFFCSYGLNPEYRDPLEAAGLRVSGWDPDGEARVVELAEHPFFVGTLYVPQARSIGGARHPLLVGLLEAAGLA